ARTPPARLPRMKRRAGPALARSPAGDRRGGASASPEGFKPSPSTGLAASGAPTVARSLATTTSDSGRCPEGSDSPTGNRRGNGSRTVSGVTAERDLFSDKERDDARNCRIAYALAGYRRATG